jgi:three-Cys-motif partner protein
MSNVTVRSSSSGGGGHGSGQKTAGPLHLPTDRKDTLWKLEPATAAKHVLYKKYLDAWYPIMLQSSGRAGPAWKRITYVDAFAGPGEYLGGEEGSPVFALDHLVNHEAVSRMGLSRERVHLAFTENRPDRFEHLKAVLSTRFGPVNELQAGAIPRKAEASAVTSVLAETGAWGCPILAVFDSWGNVNVPLRTMRRFATNPASEVIVTFGPNWFSRREDLNPDMLDAVFGGRAYWEPADREVKPEQRWRTWLAAYRDALRRTGFRYVLQFEIVPRTGHPLYLVYGTGHEKGVEVMKAAMWEADGNDGMSFRDPRTRGGQPTGQQTLWSATGVPHDELLDLVTQRLEPGPVSLEELRTWLLTETARWRRPDAAKAIRYLRDSDRVTVAPAGRITGTSVVRLR